jgi:hypothetical protein
MIIRKDICRMGNSSKEKLRILEVVLLAVVLDGRTWSKEPKAGSLDGFNQGITSGLDPWLIGLMIMMIIIIG